MATRWLDISDSDLHVLHICFQAMPIGNKLRADITPEPLQQTHGARWHSFEFDFRYEVLWMHPDKVRNGP